MKLDARKNVELGLGYWIVTIDQDVWKDCILRGKKRVESSIEVPGFRKGRAPLNQIEKYITPEKYLKEAYFIAIVKAFDYAKEQKIDIEPFSKPQPKPIKLSDIECVIEFNFDLKPVIEIKEYKDIKAKELKKNKISVTDEEINQVLEKERERLALEKNKGEKAIIKNGDLVVFDFVGYVDGKQFDGGDAIDFRLIIGSNQFIPGFESEMIGKTYGKSEIKVTFPANYTKELSNKDAIFKLNIKEIYERILPNLDDDLAADIAIKGIDTFEKLKEHIKKQIFKQKDLFEKKRFLTELVTYISKKSQIELPKAAIEKEIDNLYEEFENKLKSQNLTIKEYCGKTHLTKQDIRDELRNDAMLRLKTFLVMDEVRKKEKFDITDDEINQKIEDFAMKFGVTTDFVLDNKLISKENAKDELIQEKIIDFLYNKNNEE